MCLCLYANGLSVISLHIEQGIPRSFLMLIGTLAFLAACTHLLSGLETSLTLRRLPLKRLIHPDRCLYSNQQDSTVYQANLSK